MIHAVMLAACLAHSSLGQARPSCAVLTFDVGTEIDPGFAGVLANHYARLLKQSGRYTVQPRIATNEKLEARDFTSRTFNSPVAAALAAGAILEVDQIFHGLAELKENTYYLTAWLVDTEAGRALLKASTSIRGDLDHFVEAGTRDNVMRLLNHDSLPPSAAAKKAPRPQKSGKTSSSDKDDRPESGGTATTPRDKLRAPALPAAASDVAEVESDLSATEASAVTRSSDPPGRWQSYETARGTLADWNERWFAGRVEIGTRNTIYSLLDDDADLGSIEGIDDSQDYRPNRIVVNVRTSERWVFQLALDKLKGRTVTDDRQTDGVFKFSGPIFSLLYYNRGDSSLTPFAGLGLAIYDASFSEATYWRYGYPDTQTWIDAGRPRSPSASGRRRSMRVDDPVGIVISGGVDWRFHSDWVAEFLLRYMSIETHAAAVVRFRGRLEDSDSATFTFDNIAGGIGIRRLL